MNFVFLKDYGPFKKRQIAKLPPPTSAKLLSSKIIDYLPVEQVGLFMPVLSDVIPDKDKIHKPKEATTVKPKRKRKKRTGDENVS